MTSSNIVTVRMNQDELTKLDELAKFQNRSRSQLVQEAIRDLIESSDELRQQDFLRLKARLAPKTLRESSLYHSYRHQHLPTPMQP